VHSFAEPTSPSLNYEYSSRESNCCQFIGFDVLVAIAMKALCLLGQFISDGESVISLEMDIKWVVIFEPGKKIFMSRHVFHQHRYTCLVALPVQTRSVEISDCCLNHFRTWSGVICDFLTSLREFLCPVVSHFTLHTLPTIYWKHFFMDII
jgi:hypothetical protein